MNNKNKYIHAKSVKDKEALIYSSDMRKADTHTTRELTYGKELPNGHPNKGSSGRSLGVSYDPATGEITKQHRADSVI